MVTSLDPEARDTAHSLRSPNAATDFASKQVRYAIKASNSSSPAHSHLNCWCLGGHFEKRASSKTVSALEEDRMPPSPQGLLLLLDKVIFFWISYSPPLAPMFGVPAGFSEKCIHWHSQLVNPRSGVKVYQPNHSACDSCVDASSDAFISWRVGELRIERGLWGQLAIRLLSAPLPSLLNHRRHFFCQLCWNSPGERDVSCSPFLSNSLHLSVPWMAMWSPCVVISLP